MPQSWVHNCETANRRVDIAEFVSWSKACGVDPQDYSGFAFGFGLERMCALMYTIDDIRLMFDGPSERLLP